MNFIVTWGAFQHLYSPNLAYSCLCKALRIELATWILLMNYLHIYIVSIIIFFSTKIICCFVLCKIREQIFMHTLAQHLSH